MQVIDSCRGMKVGPRHPDGSKFCVSCNHYTLTTIEDMCSCCGIHVPSKQSGRHLNTKKVLDKLLKNCGHLINNGASFPIDKVLEPGWHLRIGPRTHWVPLKWLVRYAELPGLETRDGQDKWEEFIHALITETHLELPMVTIAR